MKLKRANTERRVYLPGLKKAREAAGYTQLGLSEELGCAQSRIGDWERERSSVPVEVLDVLADLCETTKKDLLNESNRKPKKQKAVKLEAKKCAHCGCKLARDNQDADYCTPHATPFKRGEEVA